MNRNWNTGRWPDAMVRLAKELEALNDGRAPRDATFVFGAAVAEQRREWFAWSNNLQFARRGKLCLLVDRRCRHCFLGCERWIRGADHPTLWRHEGRPACFTFEPYGLKQAELATVLAFAESHDLELRAGAEGSWQFPGRTLLVELWRKDALRSVEDWRAAHPRRIVEGRRWRGPGTSGTGPAARVQVLEDVGRRVLDGDPGARLELAELLGVEQVAPSVHRRGER